MFDALESYRDREVDLDALVEVAGHLIASGSVDQGDARVASRPDGRTVRYYQTLGLVSRPVRYDGRQAVYGFRHLLEVVAIKMLQAQGMSLAQVQRALAGTPSDRLEVAVQGALRTGPGRPVPMSPPTSLGGADGVQDDGPDGSGAGDPEVSRAESPDVLPGDRPARDLYAAEVAPGVVVTVDPARVAAPSEVIEQIRSILARRDTPDRASTHTDLQRSTTARPTRAADTGVPE
jgi:DNA-binding transcriptional MerR regulator